MVTRLPLWFFKMPKTHQKSGTIEHLTWKRMRQRCLNNNERFKHWSGRGITICERWNKFENFLEDMGQRPGPGYSLDRIDNNKGYSPDNCRWATYKQQMSNTTFNRLITYKGETKTIVDWAIALGMPRRTLAHRLDRWTLEDAFETPRFARRWKNNKDVFVKKFKKGKNK